jgi:hypothetical protein
MPLTQGRNTGAQFDVREFSVDNIHYRCTATLKLSTKSGSGGCFASQAAAFHLRKTVYSNIRDGCLRMTVALRRIG